MSLMESLDSTAEVSLKALFDGADLPVCSCSDSLEEIAFLICRGGWPRAATLQGRTALQQALDYVDAVTDSIFLVLTESNESQKLPRNSCALMHECRPPKVRWRACGLI